MSTLILYSGGQNRGNHLLHRELVRAARLKATGPLRLTYLPFCSDGSMTYFMRAVRRYSRFGVSEFCRLSADERPSPAQIRAALKTDIVYLAGGNTFYFLKALQKSGLLPHLREFADRGGILAGLSAGAHILTPNIALAGAAGLDPDDNEVGLRTLEGLALAPFEILPHFQPTPSHLKALRAYSRRSRFPIYACPDGSGIIVERGKERPVGRGVRIFSRGVELAK